MRKTDQTIGEMDQNNSDYTILLSHYDKVEVILLGDNRPDIKINL
jgi:hypothetical protein